MLAPFDRYRAAAPVVVRLAERGLHALERELVAARDHCNLLGVVEELDVLLDRMVELDLAGWNLAGAAAIDDLDVLAAGQALRDPAGIHRDVAATDHHHRLRHLGALARVHSAQEPHSVDDPLVLLSRNPHRLAPPGADGEQDRVVALLELPEAHLAAERGVEVHLEPGATLHQPVDVLVDDAGREPEGRDPPDHHAPEAVRHLVDVHRVAGDAEIVRGHQQRLRSVSSPST